MLILILRLIIYNLLNNNQNTFINKLNDSTIPQHNNYTITQIYFKKKTYF